MTFCVASKTSPDGVFVVTEGTSHRHLVQPFLRSCSSILGNWQECNLQASVGLSARQANVSRLMTEIKKIQLNAKSLK